MNKTVVTFPVEINNKKAFSELMSFIEENEPNIRWNAGERPTSFSPAVYDFPIKIYLRYDRLTFENIRIPVFPIPEREV